jgi:hypothetical protein
MVHVYRVVWPVDEGISHGMKVLVHALTPFLHRAEV